MPDEQARMTAWVHGHVQGVGFRYWTKTQALELGLLGYAANQPDGRVRVVSAEERAGANHARNAGAATARHDVILFCDADDAVHRLYARGGAAVGPVDVSARAHRRVRHGAAQAVGLELQQLPRALGAGALGHIDSIGRIDGLEADGFAHGAALRPRIGRSGPRVEPSTVARGRAAEGAAGR